MEKNVINVTDKKGQVLVDTWSEMQSFTDGLNEETPVDSSVRDYPMCLVEGDAAVLRDSMIKLGRVISWRDTWCCDEIARFCGGESEDLNGILCKLRKTPLSLNLEVSVRC